MARRSLLSEDEGSAGEHGGREVSMLTRRGTGFGGWDGFPFADGTLENAKTLEWV